MNVYDSGIIFIETSLSFHNQKIEKSLEDLKQKIIGKLNLIERVNRVILIKTDYTKKRDRLFSKSRS